MGEKIRKKGTDAEGWDGMKMLCFVGGKRGREEGKEKLLHDDDDDGEEEDEDDEEDILYMYIDKYRYIIKM